MKAKYKGLKRHFKSHAGVDPRMKENPTISRKTTIPSAEVIDFYVRDDNSRASAGKKETRTSNGEKEQIRYLNYTVDQLYHKFLSERGPEEETIGKSIQYCSIYKWNVYIIYFNYVVGRSRFYSLKPFFVIKPQLKDRGVCLCIKCTNFQVPQRNYC